MGVTSQRKREGTWDLVGSVKVVRPQLSGRLGGPVG